MTRIFNDFFSNAVKNLNIESYAHFSWDEYFLGHDVIDDPILNAINKYKSHPSILKIKDNISENECFSFKNVDLLSIIKEITNLNESKTCPMESIPAKIIKENLDILAPKILIDVNASFKTGIFPKNQKLADVSPIFKDNDKHYKGNY